MSCRFDWYQATVDAEVSPLLGALSRVVDGPCKWEHMAKSPHGYAFGNRLLDEDGQVAMVWWGGCHQLPHVVSSGESAQVVAEFLRTEFVGHRVTRADACIDYADAGAYDRLQGLALGVAEEKGIRVGTAGDHLLTLKGRTLYLGAPTSHTRLRLYDKAEELRQKFKHDQQRLAAIPAELTRLECEVRPKTPSAKRAAAMVSPVELMGSSAWMRELMRRVCGLELEPFQAGRAWRQSDDDRAYAALLAQYGGLLKRRRDDLGSWDCVGLQLGDDLARRAPARRRAS